MSAPFLKTVSLQPPSVPAGTDVRNMRAWMEQMRQVVGQCVQAINSASLPYTPRISAGSGGGDAGAATDPAYYTTIGQNVSEGLEAAEVTTWTAGDVDLSSNLKGCWFYAMTRVVYNNLGDKIIYGYIRKITIDETGRVYAVGPETRVNIDTCVGI